jgi:hypothetical protein
MMIGVRRVAGSLRRRRHNSLPLIPGSIRFQDDQRRRLALIECGRKARFARQRSDNRKAFALEIVFQAFADIRIIFNDENWPGHLRRTGIPACLQVVFSSSGGNEIFHLSFEIFYLSFTERVPPFFRVTRNPFFSFQ